MKSLALIVLLVVVVQSQKPHPCGCPKEWEGRMLQIMNGGDMKIQGWISYDGKNERIRISVKIDEYRHKTKFLEVIFLYKEKRMYMIENKNESCKVKDLDQSFQDAFRIPSSAIFLTEEYVGSSGVSDAGVLLHTFSGQTDSGKYLVTVTAKRCLPVLKLFHIKLGTVFIRFYDIVLGIADPEKFVPPDICDGKEPDGLKKPDFSFSLF